MKKKMIALVSACFLTLAVIAAPMYFQLSCGEVIYSDTSYYESTAEMLEVLELLEDFNC